MQQQISTPKPSNLIQMPPSQSMNERGLFDMPGVKFTPVGLVINPGMPIDDWVDLGARLKRAGDSVGIWRGDWINYGKHEYGKKYEAALALTGLKECTLRDDVWVSKAVPLSFRNDKLSTKHYKVVAPLKSKSKIRMWLERAITGDGKRLWSAARLRKEIHRTAPTTASAEGDKNYLEADYKQFLLDYIESQAAFLNRCTYEPFKREIERTISRARYQLGRTEGSDYEAFLAEVNSGATTVAEIAEVVPISDEEIEAFCERAIGCPRPTRPEHPHRTGTDYEWRPIGKQLPHGVRPRGIFRKDAVSGDSFSSGYRPLVEYGDEEHF